MKLEIEMTDEQFRLMIASIEIYARSLMGQADLVSDFLAEDIYPSDRDAEDHDEKFREWIRIRDKSKDELKVAFDTLFLHHGKSDTCENLIDMWHVLRHLQYLNEEHKGPCYDVRACEPRQVGPEPLMKIKQV